MRALGALSPGQDCRPFDQTHDGFMFGESCAALVLVRPDLGLRDYGNIAGGAHLANGNRGPDPSLDGEVRVIAAALADAGLSAQQIDHVNTHGTGTPLGDDTEAAALMAAGLGHAHLNATKSLIGHGLSAAGAVETAAVLLQMQQGLLHPTMHLSNPVQPALNWVRTQPRAHRIQHALKLSFGFGGIDTAIVLSAP
jgi:malonyl-ACP decarboxylase